MNGDDSSVICFCATVHLAANNFVCETSTISSVAPFDFEFAPIGKFFSPRLSTRTSPVVRSILIRIKWIICMWFRVLCPHPPTPNWHWNWPFRQESKGSLRIPYIWSFQPNRDITNDGLLSKALFSANGAFVKKLHHQIKRNLSLLCPRASVE